MATKKKEKKIEQSKFIDIRDELAERFSYRYGTYNLNYFSIPVNYLSPTEENVELFNRIYRFCLDGLGPGRRLVRTPSGGISITRKNFPRNSELWDIQYQGSSAIEIVLVLTVGCFRIKFSNAVNADYCEDFDENDVIGGRTSFKVWKNNFEKFGVNIDDYADKERGRKAVKEEIESPMIYAPDTSVFGQTIENAHHLDVNSAFAAGIAEDYPELEEVIKWMYNRRSVNKKYKSYLVAAIGWFQSEWCAYKYGMLSKSARNNCNKYIRELAHKLELSGRKILLYNTDGIWYSGEMYHDENEGRELGQWKNDHKNCKLRIKSHGAYEYIEKNKKGEDEYHPVLRGRTKLDKYLPREQWEWGDIFGKNCEFIEIYHFVEGAGLITTYKRI